MACCSPGQTSAEHKLINLPYSTPLDIVFNTVGVVINTNLIQKILYYEKQLIFIHSTLFFLGYCSKFI